MRRVFAIIPYLKGTLFFIPILLLCCQSYAYAAAANLQWDPSSEPSWLVGGYIVYYKTGSPGEPYGTWIDVGNVTEYTLTGLDDDEPYFISVAVYTVDDTPIESNYSNEVAVLPITSPQDGFYVNASNYTSYMVEGKASPNADDIIVKAGSDQIGGLFEDDDGDGNWFGACDFSSITEGAVILTAESYELNGITVDSVAGTLDITAPGRATALSSSSHTTSVSSDDNTVDLTWTAAADTGGSGLDGYSILWDTTANTTPDTIKDIEEVTTATSAALTDGSSHYFHIRAVDTAGNWGDTEHYGPFYIDTTAPNSPAITTNEGVDYSTTDSSITLNGTCAADTVAIYVNGSTDGVTYTPGETSWTYTGTLESGENTFNITAEDAAGNLSDVDSITITDTNLKPYTPILSSPTDGETGVSLTPELKTGDFSDPDADDTHAQSQWQNSTESDFSSLLLDITSTSHLTSLTVPQFILDEGTTYYWRVRFYDNNLLSSDWSEYYSFTTLTTANDQNSNGIPDDQEVDSTVDLDGDGTADINQSDMKCVNTVVGNEQVCIKGDTNVVSIESLESIDPDTISDNTNRPETIPFGLITFKLTVSNPGDTANVILYSSVVTEYTEEDLEAFIETGKWYYKYDSINGWQNYSDHATLSEDRDSIILELRDQGYGDADGTANAIIVDPSGLGTEPTTPEPTPTPTGDGGDGDGCFIATVAFGSNMDRHVKILSAFMDRPSSPQVHHPLARLWRSRSRH